MSTYPSPAQIERAMSAAMQLLATIKSEGNSDLDDQLLADTIEGETDAMDLLDRIIETSVADKLMSEIARGRAKRFEERADRCRKLALAMMEELGLQKLERPVYTASLVLGPQSVEIEDASLIPPAFQRTTPDKDQIKRALLRGERIAGAVLSNAATVLRVLTK